VGGWGGGQINRRTWHVPSPALVRAALLLDPRKQIQCTGLRLFCRDIYRRDRFYETSRTLCLCVPVAPAACRFAFAAGPVLARQVARVRNPCRPDYGCARQSLLGTVQKGLDGARFLRTRTLENAGYTVVEATTAEQAIALGTSESSLKVALLDVGPSRRGRIQGAAARYETSQNVGRHLAYGDTASNSSRDYTEPESGELSGGLDPGRGGLNGGYKPPGPRCHSPWTTQTYTRTPVSSVPR